VPILFATSPPAVVRSRDAVLAELPGGQTGALVARAGLVDPDMDRNALIVGTVDRRERGAPIDRGEPAGIAMRHHLDPTKAALMQPGYGNKPCAARHGCFRCFLQPNNSRSPMGRGARPQQDHPKPEAKSPDSPVISGEEQVAPCCGPRNPSSSATKRMNQQAPGVVRPNSTRYAQREHLGFRILS